jgi:hypothetical protein
MAFHGEITRKIVDFLEEIGIPVSTGEVPDGTFLPGILVNGAGLVVDERKLAYPGDLLHEAGHIAVMTPQQRRELYNDVSKNPGDELAALAWSWAALQRLALPPQVVFHPNGYKGESAWLIEVFSSGHTPGVPLLQWMGMTAEPGKAASLGMPAFPEMMKWMRE